MKLFKRKEQKQNGEELITKMAFQEAMRELQEEREKNESLRKDLKIFDEENKNLINNLEVLQNTIENIRKLCKDKKVVIANKILKELGD